MEQRPIASDLSYEVLQARVERGDLSQRLHAVPGWRPFIADVDEDTDAPVMDLTLGHYRPAKRKAVHA